MRLFHYFSKHFVMTLLSLLMSLFIFCGCVYFYMAFQLPDVATLKDSPLQIPLRIYTSDGQLIAEYGAMRRNPVTLDQVPKSLLNAIIATEDQRFFENSGVDFIGIIRAARELLITGQRSQGASTISMQVARNFFLTPEKTFSRKIREMLLAMKINHIFSKEKILELYLNKIYLGQHAYGVSSAAAIYYGKSLNELTLPEIAMIAGLPQGPSKENPIVNPAGAKIRRDHVLDRMLKTGYIDQKSYDAAIKVPVETYYHGPKITVDAPHVAEMVRSYLYQQYGEKSYTSGFKVYTTLKSPLQDAANHALQDGLIAYERRHHGYRGPEKNLGPLPQNFFDWENQLGDLPQVDGFIPAAVTKTSKEGVTALLENTQTIDIASKDMTWIKHSKNSSLKVGDVIRVLKKNNAWQLTQLPEVQGAIVSLDPEDGAILALNGGFNTLETGYNRVTQAQRQPGSDFKPFIYAAALEKGYTLATIVNDAPLEINDTGNANNLWRPQNDTHTFQGPTRIRMGLVNSINLVSIRILQMVGIPDTINYLLNFGFDRDQLPPYLSLALGTPAVSPMQIATGYSVFANGGYRVTPYAIKRIDANDGITIFETKPAIAQNSETPKDGNAIFAPRAIEPAIAYLITSALQDAIQHGTGYAAHVLNRDDLAGKTGTNGDLDAWFSGYNSKIETTVWMGYDQKKELREYGAQAALPIWIDFMRVALADIPKQTWVPPENIVNVRINPNDGLLAQPDDEDAIFESFRSDTAPTETSNGAIETGEDQNNGVQLF